MEKPESTSTRAEKPASPENGRRDRLRFFYKQARGRLSIRPRSLGDYLGYTGTVALALLVVQFASGLMLLCYYAPEPGRAFGSIELIRSEVPYGRLYSNLHAVSAKLLILTLFVHLFRIMIISAHRGPRKNQWRTGALLFLLILLAGFSGYLLPWSQQSYWASVIGTEALRAAPLVGDALVKLARGGENVTGATLHRFYHLHVIVLPVLIMALVWIHLKRAWKTGAIAPPSMRARVNEDDCIGCAKCEPACSFNALAMIEKNGNQVPEIDPVLCNACRACARVCPQNCISFASPSSSIPLEPFCPHNLIRRLQAVIAGLIVLFFGVFFMQGLLIRDKFPADPMFTPDRIKPDWYFLAAYQVLRKLPSKGLGLITLMAVALLFWFLPTLDRTGPRDYKRRSAYLFLVIVGIIAFVILTIMGSR